MLRGKSSQSWKFQFSSSRQRKANELSSSRPVYSFPFVIPSHNLYMPYTANFSPRRAKKVSQKGRQSSISHGRKSSPFSPKRPINVFSCQRKTLFFFLWVLAELIGRVRIAAFLVHGDKIKDSLTYSIMNMLPRTIIMRMHGKSVEQILAKEEHALCMCMSMCMCVLGWNNKRGDFLHQCFPG